jgi:hypothetical protein
VYRALGLETIIHHQQQLHRQVTTQQLRRQYTHLLGRDAQQTPEQRQQPAEGRQPLVGRPPAALPRADSTTNLDRNPPAGDAQTNTGSAAAKTEAAAGEQQQAPSTQPGAGVAPKKSGGKVRPKASKVEAAEGGGGKEAVAIAAAAPDTTTGAAVGEAGVEGGITIDAGDGGDNSEEVGGATLSVSSETAESSTSRDSDGSAAGEVPQERGNEGGGEDGDEDEVEDEKAKGRVKGRGLHSVRHAIQRRLNGSL